MFPLLLFCILTFIATVTFQPHSNIFLIFILTYHYFNISGFPLGCFHAHYGFAHEHTQFTGDLTTNRQVWCRSGARRLYSDLPAGLWRWQRGCAANGWRCYPGAAPVYSAGRRSQWGGWASGCPSTGRSWRPLGNGKASWSAPAATCLPTPMTYLERSTDGQAGYGNN